MKKTFKTLISLLLTLLLLSSTTFSDTVTENTSSNYYRTITEDKYVIRDLSLETNRNFSYEFYKEEKSGKINTFLQNKGEVTLKVPYNVDGYYSVYVGLLDTSSPFSLYLGDTEHNVDLRDYHFTNSLNNSLLRELFITNYTFSNEGITIKIPEDSIAKIAYIKLVKLTSEEALLWQKQGESSFPVFYDNDGYTDFFQGENSSAESFMENSLYQYQRLNANINYCIGTSGLLLYDSRITGRPYDNFDKYKDLVREGDLKANRDVLNLLDTAGDPLELITDQKGNTTVYASVRVNSFLPDDYRGFFNGNLYEQLQPYKQPDNAKMDFVHEEYRNYLLSVIMELIVKFDVDGITLDFTRNPDVFHKDNGTTSTERKNILTEFIKAVDELLGPDLKLNVRFPHDYAKYDLDITTWIRNGYVDSISPSDMTYESGFNVDKFLNMVEGTDVKLYVSITANLAGHDLTPETEKLLEELGIKYLGIKYLDVDNYLKRTYDLYNKGVDGVLLFNIAAQTGEYYAHPKKMKLLTNPVEMEKWYHFDYLKTPKPEKVIILKEDPLDDTLVAY